MSHVFFDAARGTALVTGSSRGIGVTDSAVTVLAARFRPLPSWSAQLGSRTVQ
ncbi:hypothetical protein ACFYXF_01915 [Streptomyces sp. NPDC002680]|uniref:hypothetical protein n=1 Tax=Streptomyces sp. NPDC002680 TaxID=3364659 RepID=UPI00368B6916